MSTSVTNQCLQLLLHSAHYSLVKYYALTEALSSKAWSRKCQELEARFLRQGTASPLSELGGRESAVSSRSEVRENVEFGVFWSFKKSSIFIHRHTSHVILTATFNDFAFMMGMTVSDQVGLKSQQAWLTTDHVGLIFPNHPSL